jgi:hypothetical protein
MAGPDCSKMTIDEAGNVTIQASAADLKSNEALNLINDMVSSHNSYGAWVGTSIPSGTRQSRWALKQKTKTR